MKNKEQEKLIEKGIREMQSESFLNWAKLCVYLRNELKDGKRDFRIAFQDDKKFIVHPLDKDGETLDHSL